MVTDRSESNAVTQESSVEFGAGRSESDSSQPAAPISVLYIHCVGAFGGSSRSLLEVLRAFPEARVKAHLVTQRGKVTEVFRQQGIPVIETGGISQFDNTDYGHYRGRRWLVLLREIYYAGFTLAALLRARRSWNDIEVVHVNDITMLLPVVLGKLLFRRPVVVHARCLQDTSKASWGTSLVRFVLTRFADAVIAIDENVKSSLPSGVSAQAIHNGLSLDMDGDRSGRRTLENDGLVRFGMVGTLVFPKGVLDFIEAARLCVQRNVRARFVIIGEDRRTLSGLHGLLIRRLRLGHNMSADIQRYIREHRLEGQVEFRGFMTDLQQIYGEMDVLCSPTHVNAVGRPVFEAAFFRVPSLISAVNPQQDMFIDGQTAMCIEPRNPETLAAAMQYLAEHPDEIKRMGELAHQFAIEHFDIRKSSQQLFRVYQDLCRKSARATSGSVT